MNSRISILIQFDIDPSGVMNVFAGTPKSVAIGWSMWSLGDCIPQGATLITPCRPDLPAVFC